MKGKEVFAAFLAPRLISGVEGKIVSVPVSQNERCQSWVGKATHSSFARHFFSDVIHNDALIGCRQRGGALASSDVIDNHQVLIRLFVVALGDVLLFTWRAAAADVAIVAQWRRWRTAVRLDTARKVIACEECDTWHLSLKKLKFKATLQMPRRFHPDDKIQRRRRLTLNWRIRRVWETHQNQSRVAFTHVAQVGYSEQVILRVGYAPLARRSVKIDKNVSLKMENRLRGELEVKVWRSKAYGL